MARTEPDRTGGRDPEFISSGRPTSVSGRFTAQRRDVVAEDLFGSVPSHWEVTRVEATAVRDRDEHVVVTGHILCRPRGVRSFDLCHVPFAHIWTMRGGEALRVLSYLDGIELQRM